VNNLLTEKVWREIIIATRKQVFKQICDADYNWERLRRIAERSYDKHAAEWEAVFK
jgi:hypothetical protein